MTDFVIIPRRMDAGQTRLVFPGFSFLCLNLPWGNTMGSSFGTCHPEGSASFRVALRSLRIGFGVRRMTLGVNAAWIVPWGSILVAFFATGWAAHTQQSTID